MISIIVAVYNTSELISKCIDCLLAQTYKDIEVILVDDGSTDESPTVCDAYAAADDRVKVIHKKNGGLSAARNTGLENASGNYVYFVDGDDMIHKECILTLKNIMDETNADIVQCGIQCFLDESKINQNVDCSKSYIVKTGKEMCYSLMFGEYGSVCSVVWNKLYKKSIFDTYKFTDGVRYDDVSTVHKLYWAADKVAFLPSELAFYRSKRSGSITHSGHLANVEQINAAKLRCDFFKEAGEKALYEQGMYLMCNDYAKIRTNTTDKNLKKSLKSDHIDLYKKVRMSSISVIKKLLAFMGAYIPNVWMAIWKIRKVIKTIVEWKGQTFELLARSKDDD